MLCPVSFRGIAFAVLHIHRQFIDAAHYRIIAFCLFVSEGVIIFGVFCSIFYFNFKCESHGLNAESIKDHFSFLSVDILEHADPSIGKQKSGDFFFVRDKGSDVLADADPLI